MILRCHTGLLASDIVSCDVRGAGQDSLWWILIWRAARDSVGKAWESRTCNLNVLTETGARRSNVSHYAPKLDVISLRQRRSGPMVPGIRLVGRYVSNGGPFLTQNPKWRDRSRKFCYVYLVPESFRHHDNSNLRDPAKGTKCGVRVAKTKLS